MPKSKQLTLLEAVAADDFDRVEKALAAGADPAIPLTVEEYLPWYLGRNRFADLLHEAWAEDNQHNRGLGFHVIFESKSLEVFELLIDKGIQLEAVDRRCGTSILHYCLTWGSSLFMNAEHRIEWDIGRRLKVLELLLKAGADVDSLDPQSGRSALQNACAGKDDGAVISLLLNHGASPGAVGRNGDTPLHAAACHYPKWPLDQYRHIDMFEPWGAQEAVQALVRAGADPNAVNSRNGYTPLHWAAGDNDRPPYLEMMEALYSLGAKVSLPNRAGRRPLDFSPPENDRKAADLKAKFILAAKNEEGEKIQALVAEQIAAFSFESAQIMMWDAVSYNDAACLKVALAAGADPNRPLTIDEYINWLFAVQAGTPDVELAAIDDDRPKAGFYVIYEALKHPELLKIILGAGAAIEHDHGLMGNWPLIHHLIHYSNSYLFSETDCWKSLVSLLEAGAEVDVPGDHGQTPLQYACSAKLDGGLINILLKYGASVQASDDRGDTALHCAAHNDEGYKLWPLDTGEEYEPSNTEKYHLWGAKDAVRALIGAGADPHAVNDRGRTPMHYAVDSGFAYWPLVEALLEYGARMDIPDKNGLRPIDCFIYPDPRADALKELWK